MMHPRSKIASAINVLIVALLFAIAHIRWSVGIGYLIVLLVA